MRIIKPACTGGDAAWTMSLLPTGQIQTMILFPVGCMDARRGLAEPMPVPGPASFATCFL